ncbi:cytochrome P450 [Mycena rosella]|uniref:Cytochrome P450 n=1 Tax=Mycena rosella TaxID=1033263 RepID=A0AAD7CS09_MYCRO|nr:cytochrome P450 [Mycena rosella]
MTISASEKSWQAHLVPAQIDTFIVSPQNPAFGVPQIRGLTSVFVDKSHQLRNIWAGGIASAAGECARIEVLFSVSKMTLDVIGQAGFNYQFNALDPAAKPSELNKVFSQIFHVPHSPLQRGLRLAQAMVPELLEETRASLESGADAKRRDLPSLLLKANAGEKIPLSDKSSSRNSQRFSSQGTKRQGSCHIIRSRQSPTNPQHSDCVGALRARAQPRCTAEAARELLAMDTEDPTLDELNALPYVENVTWETLPAHSSVAYTSRMAMEDDVLPLRRPYLDRAGGAHESPRRIPDTEIWGDDAVEFRPERWEDIPDAATAVRGVWAHLFTFLAGPRNCGIGFRFALAELKALLFVLIRAFEFEMAVPEGDVGRTSSPVQRPAVLSEKIKGRRCRRS